MTEHKKTYAKRNRRHLTEANLLSLSPKRSKQFLVWDCDTGSARGLAVLVSPSGTKSFRCTYRFPGVNQTHWMHLGRVGVMTLAEAREATRKVQAQAMRGEDPKADTLIRSDTVEAVIRSYIQHEQVGRHGNRSAVKTQGVMLNGCAPWLHRPIATVRFQEVQQRLWVIRDGDEQSKPRPYLANRLYSHLSDFFKWSLRTKLIAASPMQGMERPWTGAKPRSRDWFKKEAGDAAITSLWHCADQIGGLEGRYLKVMLVLGKRKTALANMRWEEIDSSWYWDAPASTVKNKRLHGVPLPPLVQRVLHPRQAQGRVFDDLALEPLQAKIRRLSGISDFFFHGVRHLCETKCAELRDDKGPVILPHIRDLLFDHVSKRGSGKGYDHHDYRNELRAALTVWSEYIERLVQSQDKVTVLR